MNRIYPICKHEIYRRIGHIAVGYKQYILIWSGFKAASMSKDYCSTKFIWMYNCYSELWSAHQITGEVPSNLSGSSGVVLDNYLYIFGGIEEDEEAIHFFQSHYLNKISRLNLTNFTWEVLHPTGEEPLLCDKSVGWSHDDKVYFFGGYGPTPRGRFNAKFQFFEDPGNHRKGWNNRLICYDIVNNDWCNIVTKGPPPSPRAAHSCEKISNKIFIFGGRLHDARLNDLHIFNLDNHSWSGNVLLNHNGPRPCGMSWHSFTAVNQDTCVLYGGLNSEGFPNCQWWILKINDNEYTWTGKDIPEYSVWHTAVFSKATNEIVIVGGLSASPYTMDRNSYLENQVLIQVAPRSLFRECLLKIVNISVTKSDLYEEMKEYIKTMPTILQDVINQRILQGTENKLVLSI